jgi:hypothetical protein
MLLEMQEETGNVPKALEDRPVLAERWSYAKEVFDDLSGSRPYTMNGPLPIPVTEYAAYAAGYKFSSIEWREVFEDLQIIDTVWLDEIGKRQPKKGS